MAPIKRPPCRFFPSGRCKNGDSCAYSHQAELVASNPLAPSEPNISKLSLDCAPIPTPLGATTPTQPCRFFLQGFCSRGEQCWYVHPQSGEPQPQIASSTKDPRPHLEPEPSEGVSHSARDSRRDVPCTFFSRPGGCRNASCPYLHESISGTPTAIEYNHNYEINDDSLDDGDDSIRDFAGASVFFNDIGKIIKVSLPTDFSAAYVTGIKPGTNPGELSDALESLGFIVPVENIRILAVTMSSPEAKAIIKVEDPSFATKLSTALRSSGSSLSATSVSINKRKTNCRKVYISWHKPSRTIWLNFGNGDIAKRVGQKFCAGKYNVKGQILKALDPKSTSSARNPVAWTVVLNDVPPQIQRADIENAIIAPHDKPRHIEMGQVSYHASEAEVSVSVRSRLEEYGVLENFYLAPFSKGKRSKAVAWFQDEGDAKSACSLDKKSLPILNGGKLTVTLVRSFKVKVTTAIYYALKSTIDHQSRIWKQEHLLFSVYPDKLHRYTTLKVEGDDAAAVEKARKALEEILSGKVLAEGLVCCPALNKSGTAFQAIKALAMELEVVIIRNKAKQQLLYHGPLQKLQQATDHVTDILKHDVSSSVEIDLTPEQFFWAITGGFKAAQQILGKDVLVFNIVTRKITVNGTRQQYETANALFNQTHVVQVPSQVDSASQGDCPICFCEAENPIHTSCQHTYCLECFEENCKAAASISGPEFQIKCQGDEGMCPCIFSLTELKELLSSSAFESVLQASFEEHIKRHPESFRYCPTPNCGCIYRCATEWDPKTHICPNCLEPICAKCHACHDKLTCAEYRDIASGGYEALKKLKQEMNIKDCPRCATLIEKSEGCNHMTCAGCKAHICWVCMEVFEQSGPCYGHMNRVHGGIGLGLERFAY